ncbi:MAG: hypothetical protein UZ20_WS6002001167 [candidate division WS6 bacterium OLB21]|uniref:Uncharacterized protein n=1 Tax=candidate division WS6 bacterium OLB21 TaxID=1617427 RepID=A0A136KE68_9BACT|nr:MAG: hypothetical protein UZ20_WS6002001167 [candidate division WS6 bacterium OLB21]
MKVTSLLSRYTSKIKYPIPNSRPVEMNDPIIPYIAPSRINGALINQTLPPTSCMIPISSCRLKVRNSTVSSVKKKITISSSPIIMLPPRRSAWNKERIVSIVSWLNLTVKMSELVFCSSSRRLIMLSASLILSSLIPRLAGRTFSRILSATCGLVLI